MSGEDVVLAIGYRDPESERVAGDIACARAIAQMIDRDRAQMVQRVAAAIVEHGQHANGQLVKLAARGLGVDVLALAAQVSAIEFRSRPQTSSWVPFLRRD